MIPYYDHAGITIYHGDCLEVLPQCPRVDLVLTDPPYNVGIHYGASVDDRKSHDAFVCWIRRWFPMCRERSETVLITGQARLPDYALVEPWIWLLCWFKPASMGYSAACGVCNWEPIAVWGKRGRKDGNDVIRALTIPEAEMEGHPCPKPKGWAIGQIILFPDAKTILDPFMGSGTTLRAAKDLGRKAIGIEIEERYCEIAAKRMAQEVFSFT